jgi:hypothetical protein
MSKAPRRFQYQKRDPELWRAMRREYQFDEDFRKAFREAGTGQPGRLCELLRSSEPLSDEHRAALADLIGWHLQVRTTRGRPHGSILRSSSQEFEDRIVYLARGELARLRQQNGSKNVARGMVNHVIDGIIRQFGEIHGGEPALKNVSLENIRNAVRRGTKRKPASR